MTDHQLALFSALSIAGMAAHYGVDLLLQNEWMALKKTSLLHPAAWVHSGLHTIALSFVFGWHLGVALGITHILIDTRVPLTWWGNVIKQTKEGPIALHVAFWRDQTAHILLVILAACLSVRA